jgi:hypothetical protein
MSTSLRALEECTIGGKHARLTPRVGQDASVKHATLDKYIPVWSTAKDWMAQREVNMFTIDHIDPFMNDMIEEQALGLNGTPRKDKVRLIRCAMAWGIGGQWNGIDSARADGTRSKSHGEFWRSKEFDTSFDGYWYDWKADHQQGPLHFRGVLDDMKLVQLKARCITGACQHKPKGQKITFDRSENFRDAFDVIFGCCLRKQEFIMIHWEDYEEKSRILTLRTNKAFSVAHSVGDMHSQQIEVAYEDAHKALVKAKRKKSYGQQLFPVGECPTSKLTTMIKTSSVKDHWDTALQWCLHSLRHGGAQYHRRIQEKLGLRILPNTRLMKIIHMSMGTLERTYGILEEQRSRWAKELARGSGRTPLPTAPVTAVAPTPTPLAPALPTTAQIRATGQPHGGPTPGEEAPRERAIVKYLKRRDAEEQKEKERKRTVLEFNSEPFRLTEGRSATVKLEFNSEPLRIGKGMKRNRDVENVE